MVRRRVVALVLAALALLPGCGRKRENEPAPLTFEELRDTSGLARGEPLITAVEPYRTANGVVRIRGRVGFPDATRIQISIYRGGTRQMLFRLQVVVRDGRFDSPPILGPDGPLAPGRYRFEYLALFNSAWQAPDVLRRTDQGRRLRGPGMTRDQAGGAAFYLVEERTL